MILIDVLIGSIIICLLCVAGGSIASSVAIVSVVSVLSGFYDVTLIIVFVFGLIHIFRKIE